MRSGVAQVLSTTIRIDPRTEEGRTQHLTFSGQNNIFSVIRHRSWRSQCRAAQGCGQNKSSLGAYAIYCLWAFDIHLYLVLCPLPNIEGLKIYNLQFSYSFSARVLDVLLYALGKYLESRKKLKAVFLQQWQLTIKLCILHFSVSSAASWVGGSWVCGSRCYQYFPKIWFTADLEIKRPVTIPWLILF